MKTLVILALTTFSFAAQAEPVTCNFTEPFFNVTVDEAAGTVEMNSAENDGPTHYPILDLDKSGSETRVVFGAGIEENYVLTFTRDWMGSDGMSDLVYPYSASIVVGDTDPQFGGCYTKSEGPLENSGK